MDFTTPKYAEIANALRNRIVSGAYPVGSMMPSEAEIVREFGSSRSTVVRSMAWLSQHGLIQGIQGRGRIVMGPPPTRSSQAPPRVRDALHAAEVPSADLVAVSRLPATTLGRTAFQANGLLTEGALDHFERRHELIAADVVERLSVRVVSTREAQLLTADADAFALVSFLIARDDKRRPLLAIKAVIAMPSEGLEETFSPR